MLILRIRQAECAIADGRLDEAYRLTLSPALRTHRRGQTLVQKLAEKLVERGQQHLGEGRLSEAQHDCRRAVELAGNRVDIAQLQDQIYQRLLADQAQRARRDRVMRLARSHIDRGEFSAGVELCDQLDSSDSVRQRIEVELDQKQQAAQRLAARVEQLLAEREWGAAVESLVEWQRLQPANTRLLSLRRELIESLVGLTREHLVSGRLDRIGSNLELLGRLQPESAEYDELSRTLEAFRAVGARLHGTSLGEAVRELKLLLHQLPEAVWLKDAVQQAERAAEALEGLDCGPLGLLRAAVAARPAGPQAAPAGRKDMARRTSPAHAVVLPAATAEDGQDGRPQAGDAFLIHVPGAGSALVLLRTVVTIGSAHSSRPPDLPLMGPADLPRFSIQRIEDDYFLRSESPVAVNGQPTVSKLLAHRDVIEPGRRARLMFRLPCSASTTALLELQGVQLPRADTRRVLLMSDSIVLGSDPHSHLVVPNAQRPAVLYIRDRQPVVKVGGQAVGLRWGAANDMGGWNLTLTRADQLGVSGHAGQVREA